MPSFITELLDELTKNDDVKRILKDVKDLVNGVETVKIPDPDSLDKDPEANAKLILEHAPKTAAIIRETLTPAPGIKFRLITDEEKAAFTEHHAPEGDLFFRDDRTSPMPQPAVVPTYPRFKDEAFHYNNADRIMSAAEALINSDEQTNSKKRIGVYLLEQIADILYRDAVMEDTLEAAKLTYARAFIGIQIFGMDPTADPGGNRTKGPDTPTTDF